MSEATVDVNSKTSLAKRWLLLAKSDATKALSGYTSLLNWVFMALAVWQVIGPMYEARGGADRAATVAQLLEDRAALANDVKHWTNVAQANEQANLVAAKDKADQAAKIAELEAKLETALGGEGPKQPVQKAALVPEPPINKVRVRRVPATKKDDPTAWENFVAWVQAQGAGTPGAN